MRARTIMAWSPPSWTTNWCSTICVFLFLPFYDGNSLCPPGRPLYPPGRPLCPPEAANVPLRPPGMIGQPSSGFCPPRAGGSTSPPPRSRPRFPVQNMGGLFCVCSLPGGARVARPLRGQVVLFLLMRRELGLVAGGSSSVHNCSCATFSPFPICTRDRSRMARSRGE